METLLVKINEPSKVDSLMKILQSMDFVLSVDHLEGYPKVKFYFDEINAFSASTELADLTMNDIDLEIKAYRNDKKLHRH